MHHRLLPHSLCSVALFLSSLFSFLFSLIHQITADREASMVEEASDAVSGTAPGADTIRGMEGGPQSADHWLSSARKLVPAAVKRAKAAKGGYPGRWKLIVAKLEHVPPCLSDLSSHPFFAKNALCTEQLQSVCRTLTEVMELAERCGGNEESQQQVGKLQMQSDLDAVIGKLDLNLRDCRLLVKTGVLGEVTLLPQGSAKPCCGESETGSGANVRELFARLQIGHVEAKHRAVDGLMEVMEEDEKSVLSVLGRSNISALIQLLTATTPPKIREKAATLICLLTESGSCENLLVSEGVLPPLIRLVESGSLVGREKAVISLQRMSISSETARSIVGLGGVRSLIEICRTGDSISQSATAGTLKNLSAVPEVRQNLAEEGEGAAIRVMISLLDCGIVLGSKEYAAEFLQNLTASNDGLRRAVVSEGGVRSLLAYLDGPLPQESAVSALRNLVGSVPTDELIKLGLFPRLAHVLKAGSSGAQQAAASTICKISSSMETKRLVGEHGCVPLLAKMLEAKTSSAREVAAQAISSLMSLQQNAREVKKDEKSVANLVQLLDPSPLNSAKKYSVSCLLALSSSKKCKRLMISYGAIGYLKKLSEMDVPGAKKLLERLERGKFRILFSRK